MPDSSQTTTGNYSPVSVPTLWSVDHESNGPYIRTLVASRLITSLGTMPVPVAGPPGTAPEYIAVHAPFQIRVVAWVVERWGDRPDLPHWDTGNPYETLIYSDITVESPAVNQFASAWQRVEGFYAYSIATPADPTIDGVPGGTNWASVIPASLCNAEAYQFKRGIISPLNPNPQGFAPKNPEFVIPPKNPGSPY